MASENGEGSELWKILQHFNRLENPSREGFVDLMLLLITHKYGFNRVAFYEVDPYEKFAKPVWVIGPDTKDEHSSIESKLGGVSLDSKLHDDGPAEVKLRTSASLEEKFKSYDIPLDKPSRFQKSLATEKSFYGISENGHGLTEVDKKIAETFGTNDYVLITVKGRGEKVIGWFYGDYKFSQKELYENGKSIVNKEDIRQIVEITSTFLQTIRDYESRKEMERLAALGEGAAYVAHEIRNPLTSIGGFARRLNQKAVDETSKNYTSIMINEVKRLELILNQTTDFAKKDLNANLGAVEAYKTIEETINITNTNSSGITYEIDDFGKDVKIFADYNHIKAATMNLAKNAFEAIKDDPKKGKLSVGIRVDDEFAYVYFNNPQVIPPEVYSKISTPFFTTKGSKGTGLGILTVKKYMEANKGELLSYTSPEFGTTFIMKLPLYNGQDKNIPKTD